MKTTIEQRKEKAIKLMKQLQIYKPYIKDYKDKNLVTYFEHHIGYWAFQNKELNDKIKQIEEKYNITIYTATHELTKFGELYDFLYIPNDDEDWNCILLQSHGEHNSSPNDSVKRFLEKQWLPFANKQLKQIAT